MIVYFVLDYIVSNLDINHSIDFLYLLFKYLIWNNVYYNKANQFCFEYFNNHNCINFLIKNNLFSKTSIDFDFPTYIRCNFGYSSNNYFVLYYIILSIDLMSSSLIHYNWTLLHTLTNLNSINSYLNIKHNYNYICINNSILCKFLSKCNLGNIYFSLVLFAKGINPFCIQGMFLHYYM